MRHLNILIVEDDALVGILLNELLVEMGHEVCAVETTNAGAVAAAKRCHPDMMIVDVMLGSENSVSAVETILRAGPIAHVSVSGNISKTLKRLPNTVSLQKPYNERDLILAMDRALAISEPN